MCPELSRNSPRTPDIVEYLEGLEGTRREILGRHRAQEVTACFLGKTIVGRFPVMRLRGVAVVARCLVRYGSTGRDGRV
jgi:hypothetical protein